MVSTYRLQTWKDIFKMWEKLSSHLIPWVSAILNNIVLTNYTHTSDSEFDLKGPTLRLLSFASTFFGVWEGLSLGVGPFPLSPSRLYWNKCNSQL